MMSAAKSSPYSIESALPEGWAGGTLQELFVHILGGQWGVAPDEKEAPDWVRVKVIRGTEFRNWDKDKGATAAVRLIPKASLEKRELQLGDLVVEISGGGPEQPVGRVLRIDETALRKSKLPLICANFCRQVRLHEAVDSAFVAWSLRLQYARGEFNRFQTETTNIRNLNFTDFAENMEILLPPPAEQKRIVEKVEQLLACVNAARGRLSRVPAILKRFRQAVLAAACSGHLTTDWREAHPCQETADALMNRIRQDRITSWSFASANKENNYLEPQRIDVSGLPEIPEQWTWASLDEIVQEGRPIIYGIIKPGPHCPHGVPYVRVNEMTDGAFVNPVGLRRAHPARAARFARAMLAEGDILISKDGTIGRVSVVPRELEGGNITQHLVRVSPHSFISRWYFVAAIRAPQAQSWLLGELKGVALQGVNVRDFRRLPLPVPPELEQVEIVRRVDALFKLADAIERRVAAATTRAEKLTQAILAKAFRGELVPTEAELARREGRSYEPASALLARIRAERERMGRAQKSLRKAEPTLSA